MRAPWQTLFLRFERLLRYLLAGLGITVFYSAFVTILVLGGIVDSPTLAAVIASLATAPVSYAIHSRITYPDVRHNRGGVLRFAVITIASFIVVTVSMKIVTEAGLPFWVGLMIGWFVVPVVTYLINTVWVFRAKSLFRVSRSDKHPQLGSDRC